jgi:hypothetical protein
MSTSRRRLLTAFVALAGLTFLALSSGCRDKGQESATAGRQNVQNLVELVNKDVAEIERGLPEGAKQLSTILGKETELRANPNAVRTALLKMRQRVPDLGIAKSTFFALADEKGIAIRNDNEQDTMAGKDLVGAWPGIAPALKGTPFVATNGKFPGAENPAGPDKEWVAATPVKREDGGTLGLLVTGWTYRRFAYHLQESLRRDLQDELMRAGDKGKMPIIYVALFEGDTIYGATAPRTIPFPPVNEEALAKLGLVAKTAAGPADGKIEITDRGFGWAAARAPKLGDNIGVVVLRSEV